MNRSQTPIHQPENYQFYPYVGAQQSMIPQGYIQNGNFYPVMQPMIVPLFPIQQGNNASGKHQQQIISQQQHQQQPNTVIIKKPYTNIIATKPSFRPWTSDEDQHIMNMVKIHGAAWDVIARTIPHRTGFDIQNRYNELKNRIVLPMPSIQSRPTNSFFDDNDSNNENKEENSNCFMKHVSYNLNNNSNYINSNRGPFQSSNQMPENFEFIQCQYEEDDHMQNCCVLPFASPDNEFNGIDV